MYKSATPMKLNRITKVWFKKNAKRKIILEQMVRNSISFSGYPDCIILLDN